MLFPKLKIRLARKHDAKKIATIFSDINDKLDTNHVHSLIEDKSVYVVKKRKKITAAFALSIVGITGLLSFVFIKKLAVARDERGKGIGTHILSHTKVKAKRLGAFATVLFSRERAKSFYRKVKQNNWWRFFWWKH